MKHYAVIRKYYVPFTNIGLFARRRFVTLEDAVEFILQKGIAFGAGDDIGLALKAGAVFSSRKYDVLSAAKMNIVSDDAKYYSEN